MLVGLGFSVMTLTGCSEDNPWFPSGEGGIIPALSVEGSVRSAASTRAAEELTAPDVEEFSLKLTSADGSYSHTWPTLSAFPTDQGFKIGTYTMAAYYGSQEAEGFEQPYYYGEQTFQVREDENTDVSITATLANSMVSVIYTDAFKTYFKDYSAKVRTAGSINEIAFPAGEERPAYVKPGEVSVMVSFTKQNGVSANFQPQEFTAKPRHHYRITFDVNNGEVGQAVLTITFDDTLDEENVTIDLSDELLSAPAPEVTPQGFSLDTPMELMERTAPSTPVRFFIRAKSGISKATLTVNSSVVLPFNKKEFDICTLTESELAQLTAAGIKETGLSRNPGTMAQIDMTEFLGNLPAGTHSIRLEMRDKMGKTNEPVILTVNASPLQIEIPSQGTVFEGSNEGLLTINFNGTDLEQNLTVEAEDDFGVARPCVIKSITRRSNAMRRSNSFPMVQYDVSFVLPESSRDVKVYIKYKGATIATTIIKRVNAEYTLQADAFAHFVVVKPVGDAALLPKLVSSLRFFAGGKELKVEWRNQERGLVMLAGLQPDTDYTITSTLSGGTSPAMTGSVQVHTETIQAVPNGDFETLTGTLWDIPTINQGGEYKATKISKTRQNRQKFTVHEPAYWATTNAKTLNLSASAQNSWFVLPSVFNTSLSFLSMVPPLTGDGNSVAQSATPAAYQFAAQNNANAMVIRTVGYDPAGTVPGRHDYWGAGSDSYFNPNAPSIAKKAAGKLFLGSYAYDNGTETYTQGVSFASRPTALTGYYRYLPVGADQGYVIIQIMNGNTVIGEGSLNLAEQTDYAIFKVPVVYSSYFTKATGLRILFASSAKQGSIDQETANLTTENHIGLFEQEARGSVLVVDNISFIY